MLIYLKPLSIFPELHSDTLFGAIVSAISELFPEKTDEMIDSFKNEPPFILSSTFPYAIDDDRKIRFYPKIIAKQSKDDFDENLNPQSFKDYKKVKYVEENMFFDMVQGNLRDVDIVKNLDDYSKVKTLLSKDKLDVEVSFNENIIPNNSINRVNNQTEGIFYTSGREYVNMGLFFLIEFFDEEYVPLVKSAIRFLKDRGFGRDISNGKGQFDYEIDEDFSISSFYDGDGFDYFITLSRFIPNEDDLNRINEHSSYEIGSKRGKSRAGEIRKQVRFFNEGSIFSDYGKYYGKIVESGKDSPAVEYGFAFPVKCIGNREA